MKPEYAQPLGICQTRLDEKGRLRLPTSFVEYLRPEHRLSVTVGERGEVRMYPGEADGYPAEIDANGRLMMPQEAGLVRGESYLIRWKRGSMIVVPEAQYLEQMAEAKRELEPMVELLKKNGML